MDIRQFMKRKSIPDSRNVENISEKRLKTEVQPAQILKRFVNVPLHCIVNNLKRISKSSTLHPREKFLWPPMATGLDLWSQMFICRFDLVVLAYAAVDCCCYVVMSCLVQASCYLEPALTMRATVSSLSLHILHFASFVVWSIFALWHLVSSA